MSCKFRFNRPLLASLYNAFSLPHILYTAPFWKLMTKTDKSKVRSLFFCFAKHQLHLPPWYRHSLAIVKFKVSNAELAVTRRIISSDVSCFSFSYTPFCSAFNCDGFSIFWNNNNNLILVRWYKRYCSAAYMYDTVYGDFFFAHKLCKLYSFAYKSFFSGFFRIFTFLIFCKVFNCCLYYFTIFSFYCFVFLLLYDGFSNEIFFKDPIYLDGEVLMGRGQFPSYT